MLPLGNKKTYSKIDFISFIYQNILKHFLELMFIFSFKRVEKFERKNL
jgi:hypothetical protein